MSRKSVDMSSEEPHSEVASSSHNGDHGETATAELDDLEWEEWDSSKISFPHHMIAGSIAGLVEHVSIFPIDTIKTHIQYERTSNYEILSTWTNGARIVQKEGLFRLWRGVSAMFAGCIPAHSAYFAVFESCKKLFGADQDGHHPIQAAASGALAAVSHDMFMTPFDTIKQRMQLGYYRDVRHCIKTVLRTEGIGAFYLSFPTTLMMNIPFGSVMVAVNESLKKFLNPGEKYSVTASMVSGGLAGMIAAAVTTPLDVVKTRLQTQNLELCTKSCEDPVFSVAGPTTGVKVDQISTQQPTVHEKKSSTKSRSRWIPKGVNVFQPSMLLHEKDSFLGSRQGYSRVFNNYGNIGMVNGYGTMRWRRNTVAAKYRKTSHPRVIFRVHMTANSLGSQSNTGLKSALETPIVTPPPLPEKPLNIIRGVGMWQTVQKIYVEEGLRGFIRGVIPRMLVHAPSVAISWTAYEGMKSFLQEMS